MRPCLSGPVRGGHCMGVLSPLGDTEGNLSAEGLHKRQSRMKNDI